MRDYQALNSVAMMDTYPVPNIKKFSSQLAGLTIFSRITADQANDGELQQKKENLAL